MLIYRGGLLQILQQRDPCVLSVCRFDQKLLLSCADVINQNYNEMFLFYYYCVIQGKQISIFFTLPELQNKRKLTWGNIMTFLQFLGSTERHLYTFPGALTLLFLTPYLRYIYTYIPFDVVKYSRVVNEANCRKVLCHSLPYLSLISKNKVGNSNFISNVVSCLIRDYH